MKQTNRILSLLLCFIMVVSLATPAVLAVEETTVATVPSGIATEGAETTPEAETPADEPSAQAEGTPNAIVFAASDFQSSGSNDEAISNLGNIIQAMVDDGYTDVHGTLFGGDYDYEYAETQQGINDIKTVFARKGWTPEQEVYLQGNHDQVTIGTNGLSASGAHDTDFYGVYTLHEDEYMWNNSDPTTIQSTAGKLDTYLDSKVAEGYSKPIFVLSHLPLHYCYRTYKDGDGMYANYIFDVLNEAGANGLNIVFLYGHNHSHGWDSYLGYGSVYLAEGDSINIAQASKSNYKAETLNFTYMNYGFVGYISGGGSGGGSNLSSDYTLTASIFEIYDDEVVVKRYSADGVHNLKAAGALNQEYSDASLGLTANTTVYPSPQSIALTSSGYTTVWNDVKTVSVTGPELTGVTVTGGVPQFNGTSYSAAYDITPETADGAYTGTAKVTIQLDGVFASAALKNLTATVDGEACTITSFSNNVVTLTVPHFSTVEITYAVPALTGTSGNYQRVTSTDELVSVEKYLIIRADDSRLLSLETVTHTDGRQGLDLVNSNLSGMPLDVIENDFSEYEWTFTATGSQWYIGNGTQNAAFYTDSSNRYAIGLRDSGTALTISGSDTFTFSGDYNGTKYFNYNSTGDFINGYASGPASFYIYKYVTGTEPGIAAGTWYPIADASAGSTTYQLVENGVIESGENYLIVNTGNNGTGYALTSSGGRTQVTIADKTIQTVDSNAIFKLNGSNGSYSIYGSTGYLYPHASRSSWRWTYSISSGNASAQNATFTANGTAFRISRSVTSGNSTTNSYLRYSSNSFSANSSASNLYLYKEVVSAPVAGEYAKLSGQTAFSYALGKNTDEMWEDIKSKIEVYSNTTDSGEGTRVTEMDLITFSGVDTGVAGTTLVTVSYKGVPIGNISVTIAAKRAVSMKVEPMEATIVRGSTKIPSSTITITYDDGTTEEIPMHTAYLSGDGLNLGKSGTYDNLTVSYGGLNVTGFKLTITNRPGNDYPNYPEPGSIAVSKTAHGLDFQNTGLARVNLTTSGLPASKGVDLIIVVDTSSSMTNTVEGQKRVDVLRNSLQGLLEEFQQENPTTGQKPDIDLAIISFNGFTNTIDGATLDGTYRNNPDRSGVFTGPKAGQEIPELYNQGYILSERDFVNCRDTDFSPSTISSYFTEDKMHSGTNYDTAFANAYTLMATKQASNTEERDPIIIFLSDGAPFRYNGFNQAAATDYTEWAEWLDGKWANEEGFLAQYPSNQFSHFYNGDGNVHPHRMAEAIKGERGKFYDVVDPRYPENDPAYIAKREGLGATLYSIGFCLEDDKEVTEAHCKELMQVIATPGDGYCYPDVTNSDQLDVAFRQIAHGINYAATEAVFEDQMGSTFDLQMNPTVKVSNGTTKTEDTSITVTSQAVYTTGDLTQGECTAEDVGKPKGTPVNVETVTFSESNGQIVAASNRKTGTGNILVDGVIQAETFCYNTTTSPKTVTVGGKERVLPGETFAWNIDIINETQYTLSYVVYLSNAMGENGGREAGSYDTNNYARLSYINHLGNSVEKSVASPTLAWKAANVSYVYYLVNEQGEPLLFDGTKADNFLQAYRVTQPTVYSTINLNTGETVINAIAKNVLPDGYKLYDDSAVYSIEVASGDGGGGWTITGDKVNDRTTYVMDHTDSATDYTNEITSNSTTHPDYDYSHTTVYFAVLWQIGTVPDTVVIDYGLPVDIHVLANDMLGSKGTLTGIGTFAEGSSFINAHTTASYDDSVKDFTNGKVSMDSENSTVRYTPSNMTMSGKEVIGYEAEYTGSVGAGYYYGKLTVIPATTIYYEDSFLTFEGYNIKDLPDGMYGDTANDTRNDGLWETVGQTIAGVQDEDRPGNYSLPQVDGNNIYGSDGAYANMTTYSMGSARKIRVTEDQTYGNVKFTFTGTGCDIISLTSKATGTITMMVTEQGNPSNEHYYTVDTYYGYTYDAENDEWTVVSEDNNALYQVPILKTGVLPHGTYDVVISVSYYDMFHHKQDGKLETEDGNYYDFYMDAVRIYDPADNGKDDDDIKNAYVADNEGWPEYHELRNLVIQAAELEDPNSVIDGLAFIDGKGDISSIADYVSYGPNNELYLNPGEAVAFYLDLSKYITTVYSDTSTVKQSIVADIQLGVKSANGKSVTAELSNLDGSDAQFNKGTLVLKNSNVLNTSTDMYYSISNWNIVKSDNATYPIIIQNTSDEGIMSITNVKLTFSEDPTLFTPTRTAGTFALKAPSLMVQNVEEPAAPENVPVETAMPEARFYITGKTAQAVVNALNSVEPEPPTVPDETKPEETQPETTEPEESTPDETKPEETEPEETEPAPESFTPETFRMSTNKFLLRKSGNVKVTVTTSDDVDHVEINGHKVTAYTVNKWGDRTWTLNLRVESVGLISFSAVAYNAENAASKSISRTVVVLP